MWLEYVSVFNPWNERALQDTCVKHTGESNGSLSKMWATAVGYRDLRLSVFAIPFKKFVWHFMCRHWLFDSCTNQQSSNVDHSETWIW